MATGRLPDPNTAPLTAKGDLYTYSTVPARLAVGSNGDTLVADSSASTGLRWQGLFAAGKNKIINGDFYINQRGFASTTSDVVFVADRFMCRIAGDGTSTFSLQTFTPGTAPVAGYEGTNYVRVVTTGQTTATVRTVLRQVIEDVRTLAGQTITLSFWAKANSGTPKIAGLIYQNFGSGGSASVDNPLGTVTISTSWARYSLTVTLPSITGKTIGTSSGLGVDLAFSAGSNFNTQYSSIGIQTNTFEVWGIQVEAGSVATPFTTATGTLAGELAACQRYYYRNTAGSANAIIGLGIASSTTQVRMQVAPKVTMRIAPTAIEYAGLYLTDGVTAFTVLSSIVNSASGANSLAAVVTVASGLTQFRSYELDTLNTTDYIAWSAEL